MWHSALSGASSVGPVTADPTGVIIVAVIGAISTIGVALIQRGRRSETTPSPPSPAPSSSPEPGLLPPSMISTEDATTRERLAVLEYWQAEHQKDVADRSAAQRRMGRQLEDLERRVAALEGTRTKSGRQGSGR